MDIVIKTFEEFTVEELYDVMKLRSDVFVVEQTCVYGDLDGRDKRATHVLAMEEGRLCGYLRILNKGETFDETAIGRVVVHPAFRSAGTASEMMTVAMAYITGYRGEERIKLSAQQHLTGFYEKLGFQAISEAYVEDGIPHIDMEYSK